mgnify:CR=1 FL=1
MKLSILLVFISLTAFAQRTPLPTADHVEISKYVGKWYAITALPQFFTRSCRAQTAEYAVLNPQTVSVLNTCLKKNHKVSTIRGEAVVLNATTNAELQVTFDNFFTRLFRVKGDYTIIKLDPEYRYSLVGSHDRKSLWLLSREKLMPAADRREYVELAGSLGFPVGKLVESNFQDVR